MSDHEGYSEWAADKIRDLFDDAADQLRHGRADARSQSEASRGVVPPVEIDPEEVVTTLAVGEEGDEDLSEEIVPPTELDPKDIATTLAIGEEGDEDPYAVSTDAHGEEGDDELIIDPGYTPITDPPIVTTFAAGEEGDDPGLITDPVDIIEPPVVTTYAIGEEGDEEPSLIVSTDAVGEEGDDDPIDFGAGDTQVALGRPEIEEPPEPAVDDYESISAEEIQADPVEFVQDEEVADQSFEPEVYEDDVDAAPSGDELIE